jgi:UDP-N-acetylglucosamine 2-epimerase (non-hydrolysing)
MKIVHVVGARPNFMKAAPVLSAIQARLGWPQALVHTGQHYDRNMSEVFFRQLGLPEPDVNLGVGSGSHGKQTAEIMTQFERLVLRDRPGMVMVYGDVNSTLAAALVCAKLRIPVAHVEAGLRSFDMDMPEEVNRIVTDRVADLLLTPSDDADANLLREGVAREKIAFVGNVMIDTLVRLLPVARKGWAKLAETLGFDPDSRNGGPFGVVTLHRPSNVDDPARLARIITVLREIAASLPLVFPVHPRTRARITGASSSAQELLLVEPVGYLDFLALQDRAALVITDSGGIQEETTYLGTPCLTLRHNTERPVTVTLGTNVVVGEDCDMLCARVRDVLDGKARKGAIPPLWDGHAAERIADVLLARYPDGNSASRVAT